MDLEEWELLPNNILENLDLLDHDDDHQEPTVLCPSIQDPLHKTESSSRSIVPIAWEPVTDHENKKISNDPDLDPVSTTVSLKETKFADMKIDSPLPQIDDEKASDSEGGDDLREKKEVSDDVMSDDRGGGCEKTNLWKIGLNGIGAICSFGVAAAAATVCVFFLGHNNIKICKNKNQMLRFQIYSDDNKRMKEVVNQATKLNETIFAMKGVPVVRAQISFGGHYDGL